MTHLIAGLSLALVVSTGAAVQTTPLTGHQMPFPCGETWKGSTRAGHSPAVHAVDWNRTGDQGAPVVASAAGVVTKVDAVSKRSYGHHVVIDHGNGESSLYAHLDRVNVVLGQSVDQGLQVGTVGNTGNSRGAHLHFEERIGRSVVPAVFGGLPFAYGSTLASTNCVDIPLAADFTGDGIAEMGVYRRGKRSQWVLDEPAGARVMKFGKATDEPVVGDWDGDGLANLGIRRAVKSKFRLKTSTGVVKIKYGQPSDRPVVGDWDGNGVDEVGVHQPAVGLFSLRLADGSSSAVALGDTDDVAVTGDWDGNGVTDLGVYDQATAVFTLRLVDAAGTAWTTQQQLGVAGDLPVTGDWDGDGYTDLGVWTPVTATFVRARTVLAPAPPVAARPVGAVQLGRPRR